MGCRNLVGARFKYPALVSLLVGFLAALPSPTVRAEDLSAVEQDTDIAPPFPLVHGGRLDRWALPAMTIGTTGKPIVAYYDPVEDIVLVWERTESGWLPVGEAGVSVDGFFDGETVNREMGLALDAEGHLFLALFRRDTQSYRVVIHGLDGHRWSRQSDALERAHACPLNWLDNMPATPFNLAVTATGRTIVVCACQGRERPTWSQWWSERGRLSIDEWDGERWNELAVPVGSEDAESATKITRQALVPFGGATLLAAMTEGVAGVWRHEDSGFTPLGDLGRAVERHRKAHAWSEATMVSLASDESSRPVAFVGFEAGEMMAFRFRHGRWRPTLDVGWMSDDHPRLWGGVFGWGEGPIVAGSIYHRTGHHGEIGLWWVRIVGPVGTRSDEAWLGRGTTWVRKTGMPLFLGVGDDQAFLLWGRGTAVRLLEMHDDLWRQVPVPGADVVVPDSSRRFPFSRPELFTDDAGALSLAWLQPRSGPVHSSKDWPNWTEVREGPAFDIFPMDTICATGGFDGVVYAAAASPYRTGEVLATVMTSAGGEWSSYPLSVGEQDPALDVTGCSAGLDARGAPWLLWNGNPGGARLHLWDGNQWNAAPGRGLHGTDASAAESARGIHDGKMWWVLSCEHDPLEHALHLSSYDGSAWTSWDPAQPWEIWDNACPESFDRDRDRRMADIQIEVDGSGSPVLMLPTAGGGYTFLRNGDPEWEVLASLPVAPEVSELWGGPPAFALDQEDRLFLAWAEWFPDEEGAGLRLTTLKGATWVPVPLRLAGRQTPAAARTGTPDLHASGTVCVAWTDRTIWSSESYYSDYTVRVDCADTANLGD